MYFSLNTILTVLGIFAGIFIVILILLFFILFICYADADLTLLFYHYLQPLSDFRDKVVWITGAASGIGEHLAYTLVKSGAKLALSGVNIEKLTAVRERCKKITKYEAAANILLVPFKINELEVHDECMQKVLEHYGRIDIFINNSGMSHIAKIAVMEKTVDQQDFGENVFGAINLTKIVLKHFLERKEGHIVVTSSASGKLGTSYNNKYTGTKYALHRYCERLQRELVDENIDITLLCPGPIASKLTSRSQMEKNEIGDYKQKPTDKRMTAERCCELMATAISYKLDECWISLQPFLLEFYVAQYFPSKFRMLLYIMKSYFEGRKKRTTSNDVTYYH